MIQTPDNILRLVTSFLSELGHYNKELKYDLFSHFSFPSIKSIKDTISYQSIDAECFTINNNILYENDLKFITYLNTEDEQKYVWVKSKSNQNYLWLYDGINMHKYEKDVFLKKWSNNVLVAEEKGKSKKWSHNHLLFTGFLILIFIPIFSNPLHLSSTLFYILGISGLYIASLITLETLGKSSNLVKKLCSENKTFDCKSVLFSKYSTIYGNYKVSDLLITHFSTILFIFFNFDRNQFFTLNTLMCAPYIIAAITTVVLQVKLNKWCALCLLIDIILLMHIIVSIIYWNSFAIDFTTNSILIEYLIAFFAIIAIWHFVKRSFFKILNFDEVLIESLTFRRNPLLFNSYLSTCQKSFNEDNNKNWPIINFDYGYFDLFIIMQPFCMSCTQVWDMILSMQRKQRIFRSISIAFYIPEKNKSIVELQIASYFINEYNIGNDWFNEYSNWVKHKKSIDFPMYEKYLPIVGEMQKWCSLHGFTKTPSLFIDGKHIPYIYNPLDLEILLTGLIENESKITSIPNIISV